MSTRCRLSWLFQHEINKNLRHFGNNGNFVLMFYIKVSYNHDLITNVVLSRFWWIFCSEAWLLSTSSPLLEPESLSLTCLFFISDSTIVFFSLRSQVAFSIFLFSSFIALRWVSTSSTLTPIVSTILVLSSRLFSTSSKCALIFLTHYWCEQKTTSTFLSKFLHVNMIWTSNNCSSKKALRPFIPSIGCFCCNKTEWILYPEMMSDNMLSVSKNNCFYVRKN